MRYDGGSNCDYERNDDDKDCVQNAGLTHADLRLPKKRVVFHTHITPSQTNDDEDGKAIIIKIKIICICIPHPYLIIPNQ